MNKGILAPTDRLIVALDHPTAAQALRTARRLRGCIRTVKVGSILFTACGPAILRQLRALEFDVMLDLKFFDIPSTVERSCRAAAGHRVSLLTVHAGGGRDMLLAAMRGVKGANRQTRRGRPRVLAVTILTSMSVSAIIRGGPDTLGGERTMTNRVRQLAFEAQDAACDGVVASPQDAADLRRVMAPGMLIACPGIRPTGTFRDDQRRIATPAKALRDGANLLIVGRPITEARDPRAAALRIVRDMEDVKRC